MRFNWIFEALLILPTIPGMFTVHAHELDPASDAAARAAQERVATPRYTAIVFGIADADGHRLRAFGAATQDGKPPTPESIYAIASVTKVFTQVLLADAVLRGEVRLDDPIKRYLPEGWTVPTRNGHSIRLSHLITHTSGLPRIPPNFAPADRSNPYADYSLDQFREFLAEFKLSRDIGARYEYANFGYHLIGNALAARHGRSFGEHLRTRVLRPLGLEDTDTVLSPEQLERLLPAFIDGTQVPVWDHPSHLQASGGLYSTPRDLLQFTAAIAGLRPSPLRHAMDRISEPVHIDGELGEMPTMGLEVTTKKEVTIYWHDGSIFGHKSFAGWRADGARAVVVLTNSSGSVVDLGRHLLDPRFPLKPLEAVTR